MFLTTPHFEGSLVCVLCLNKRTTCGPVGQRLRLTKPSDVFVVPGQGLLAAGVHGSFARHPPQGVDVSADVEVASPQEAQSSEALFSCKHRELRAVLLRQTSSRVQAAPPGTTYLQAGTCTQTGSCLGPTLKGTNSSLKKSLSQVFKFLPKMEERYPESPAGCCPP